MKQLNKKTFWWVILFAWVAIQITLFNLRVNETFPVHNNTPFIVHDPMTHYVEAARLYSDFSLKTAISAEWPVFTWPAVVALMVVDSELTFTKLVKAMSVFSQTGMLLVALWAIWQFGGRALALSIFLYLLLSNVYYFRMVSFYDLALMGDVPISIWLVATICSLGLILERGLQPQTILLTFVLVTVGIHSKPIFALIFPVLVLVWVPFLFSRHKITFSPRIIGSVLLGVMLLIYFFPRRLFNRIELLRHINSGDSPFVRAEIDLSLAREVFAMLPNQILLTVFVLSFFYQIYRIIIKRTSDNPAFLYAASAFLAQLIFLSLFVLASNSRNSFFLIPQMMILFAVALENNVKDLIGSLRSKLIYAAVVITVLGCGFNLAAYNQQLAFLSPTLNNVSQRIWGSFPYSARYDYKNLSFEELGIMDVLDFIKQDSAGIWQKRPLHIYVPHGERYNSNSFSAADLFKAPISKIQKVNKPWFYATSSLYRMGGWGAPGGLPREFYQCDYLVFFPNFVKQEFYGSNSEVYHTLIQEHLLLSDSPFRSGLKLIHDSLTPKGERVQIFKRIEFPDKNDQIKIVERAVEKDPINPFNLPWIVSALQLAPDSELLRDAFEQTVQKATFGPAEKFNGLDTSAANRCREKFVAMKEVCNHWKYPEMLK